MRFRYDMAVFICSVFTCEAIYEDAYEANPLAYLYDDVGGESSWRLLIDLTIEVVVAKVKLKVQPPLHFDLARVWPVLSVHPAAKYSVRLHPGDHVRAL